ncbi:hypothetical protein J6590_005745 [Homalodisca vitripennis]|nr:hypothetical protein J6590_005745 [Homalodisca vitripennis]
MIRVDAGADNFKSPDESRMDRPCNSDDEGGEELRPAETASAAAIQYKPSISYFGASVYIHRSGDQVHGYSLVAAFHLQSEYSADCR